MANDRIVVAAGWLSMAGHGCRAVLWLFFYLEITMTAMDCKFFCIRADDGNKRLLRNTLIGNR